MSNKVLDLFIGSIWKTIISKDSFECIYILVVVLMIMFAKIIILFWTLIYFLLFMFLLDLLLLFN